jgi:hypothetical protein
MMVKMVCTITVITIMMIDNDNDDPDDNTEDLKITTIQIIYWLFRFTYTIYK